MLAVPEAPPFVVVCEADAPREEWMSHRPTGIGASEYAMILGLRPDRGTELSVYAAKVSPDPAPEPSEGPLRRGHDLEPIILEMGNEKLAEIGVTATREQRLLRSTRYPWAMTTLDALASDGAPTELKSHLDIDLDAPPPEEHQVQCQGQMLVTASAYAYLVILNIIEWRVRVWKIARDETYLREHLIPAGEELWACIQERREPKPLDPAASLAAWRRLHNKDDGSTVAMGEAALSMVRDWELAKAEVKAAEARAKRIQAVLEIAMLDASVAELPDGTKLTYRNQERAGYTVEPTNYRVLRHQAPRKRGKK